MYEGINLANLIIYNNILASEENKEKLDLLRREEQLLTELKYISSQELSDKIVVEFKPKYHDYNYRYYLEILERCKRLLSKGINDFDLIRKIIYKGLDRVFDDNALKVFNGGKLNE